MALNPGLEAILWFVGLLIFGLIIKRIISRKKERIKKNET